MSNFSFTRPTELNPVQAREPVEGACDNCADHALMRYPVLSEGGWYMAVKCQTCLHSQTREKWTRLGHVSLITDAIDR